MSEMSFIFLLLGTGIYVIVMKISPIIGHLYSIVGSKRCTVNLGLCSWNDFPKKGIAKNGTSPSKSPTPRGSH